MKKLNFLFLIMLATFMSVTNVNAEECTLVASYSSADYYFSRGTYGYYLRTNDDSSYAQISITKGTYYTVYFGNADTIKLNDYSFTFTGDNNLTFSKSDYYYQIISNSNYNAQILTRSPLNDWDTFHIYSSTTDTLCLPKSEPVVPDEPIIPDSTLDTFYSIFIDKITYFSNYCVENKFLLGTFGIVILFIVIEIILKFFRKGGY